jgi:tRNA 2-thiouridine synthesizing protein A
MSGETRLVDARGMLCPWPVIRLSRAARELQTGSVRLLADDPAAPREIALLCQERGWLCSSDPMEENLFEIQIG